jgi:hypothetical protein
MTDVLDLDALIPPVKKIKINGKIIDCFPLTLKQLLNIAKLRKELQNIDDPDKIEQMIMNGLSPFCPAAKEKGFDLTLAQFNAIVDFAMQSSIPQDIEKDAKIETNVNTEEKKIDSSKQ